MSSLRNRLRPLVIPLAIPILGIGLTYTLVVDAPLRKKIAEIQAKADKLAGAVELHHEENALNLQTLQQSQEALRELNRPVTTVQTAADSNEPPATAQDLVDPTSSPLSRLSATLTLFHRHHIDCLASQPVDSSDVELSKPASAGNKPVAVRSVASKSASDQPEPMVRRLTLAGRFADMHRALEEMQSTPHCLSIVSLEMEASPTGAAIHRWTIVLQD